MTSSCCSEMSTRRPGSPPSVLLACACLRPCCAPKRACLSNSVHSQAVHCPPSALPPACAGQHPGSWRPGAGAPRAACPPGACWWRGGRCARPAACGTPPAQLCAPCAPWPTPAQTPGQHVLVNQTRTVTPSRTTDCGQCAGAVLALICSCMTTREAGLRCGPQQCHGQAQDGETMVHLGSNIAAADLGSTWLGLLSLQGAKVNTKNDTEPALCCSTIEMAAAAQPWTSLQQAVARSAVMARLCLVQ